MALEPGTRIGPYEIVGLLGAGGMGEVYKGHDPRLGRDVAVKVLSGEFAADPDRLRRFEVEARAAAALNHPTSSPSSTSAPRGPCRIWSPSSSAGRRFGTRLTPARSASARTVDMARQVASGLTAAHASGITHRDLKPENIFLTADGHAKILDFGDREVGAASGDACAGPTVGDTSATDAGVILGTIGYMAPEQATGRTVDFRCDQFAFGIVVFEMLSGRRAFQRPSQVEEIAAIVRDEQPTADGRAAGGAAAAPVGAQPLPGKEPGGPVRVDRELHNELETLAAHVVQPAPPARAKRAGGVHPAGPPHPAHRQRDRCRQGEANGAARRGAAGDVDRSGRNRQDAAGPPGGARAEGSNFAGGVYFAPLSTITDADLVPQAVAHALRCPHNVAIVAH